MNNVFFVSGIDTDAGKSYCTAYIAKKWNEQGISTITQKFIQTGNVGRSEDIELHRKIMGCGMLPEDLDFTTAPEIFSYPASPLLASRIDGRNIDFDKINAATAVLASKYQAVLVEGAGGLMVPLTENMLTIDFLKQSGYPLIFVTSGKLGSINHTLLALEAVKSRNIPLYAVLYNNYPSSADLTILNDTREYLCSHIANSFPDTIWMEVPLL